MLELRQLEVFLAVADELHFGRAATRVHLSQPALTQSVARLERALDARLLERTSRRVALTPAGAELQRRARRLLADAERTEDDVRRTAQGALGVVRLGVVGSAMSDLLPALVRRLRDARPGLEVEITESLGAAQLAGLRSGHLDLGIVHLDALSAPADMETRVLREERLAAAVPADHRLSRRRRLPLAALRDDPLVLLRPEREADTHRLYLGACAAAGFAPPSTHHVGSLQALLGFVAAGLGWAFAAQSVVAAGPRPGVTFIELQGCRARLPTAVVWPVGPLAPAAAAVRDVAVAVAAPPGRG